MFVLNSLRIIHCEICDVKRAIMGINIFDLKVYTISFPVGLRDSSQ
jgi:hypothetical protein